MSCISPRAPAGYGRALLRWAGYWVAGLPLGLGFVPAFFTADRRGLHDWMSGTRVVRRPAAPVLASWGERESVESAG